MNKEPAGLALAIPTVMVALCLAACSSVTDEPVAGDSAASGDKPPLCARPPAYDWTRAVLGDHADDFDLVYLLDNGVDLHSFQPTVEGISLVSSADLFVYVGVLVMDSLQSATADDVATGVTYLSVMERNLGVLEQALA